MVSYRDPELLNSGLCLGSTLLCTPPSLRLPIQCIHSLLKLPPNILNLIKTLGLGGLAS